MKKFHIINECVLTRRIYEDFFVHNLPHDSNWYEDRVSTSYAYFTAEDAPVEDVIGMPCKSLNIFYMESNEVDKMLDAFAVIGDDGEVDYMASVSRFDDEAMGMRIRINNCLKILKMLSDKSNTVYGEGYKEGDLFGKYEITKQIYYNHAALWFESLKSTENEMMEMIQNNAVDKKAYGCYVTEALSLMIGIYKFLTPLVRQVIAVTTANNDPYIWMVYKIADTLYIESDKTSNVARAKAHLFVAAANDYLAAIANVHTLSEKTVVPDFVNLESTRIMNKIEDLFKRDWSDPDEYSYVEERLSPLLEEIIDFDSDVGTLIMSMDDHEVTFDQLFGRPDKLIGKSFYPEGTDPYYDEIE